MRSSRRLCLTGCACTGSLGAKGAELLHMPLRDFIGLMSEHKVPAAEYEAGWLEDELGAFKDTTPQGEP